MSTLKNKIANKKRGIGVVAEKERLEDEKIRKCLQEAYGYSDEQLLKEMEAAEKSLGEDEFPGVENRMFQKIMKMEAAEQAAAQETAAQKIAAQKTDLDITSHVVASKVSEETAAGRIAASAASDGKKVVRFRKKKVLLVAGLVALFVGMLGVTAIGEKSYFFKHGSKLEYNIVLDNDKNKTDISNLEEAYEKIGELGIPVVKLGYLPQGLKFDVLEISGDNAVIVFDYNGNKLHFIQEIQGISASRNTNSDRKKERTVFNRWLKRDILISYNNLKNNQTECGAEIGIGEGVYRLNGIIDIDEFEKIVENLSFFD